MSRSFKKYPIRVDNGKGARWAKTHANRLYRRCRSPVELRAGKSAIHHKYTDSWSIHDYVHRFTKAEAETDWEHEESMSRIGFDRGTYYHRTFRTKDRFMNYWKKKYLRK